MTDTTPLHHPEHPERHPALAVTDLHVTFPGDRTHPPARAVRGLTFTVRPAEILGIAGESGAGKSTAALALLGLLPDDAHVTGSVRLHGTELLGRTDRELAGVRGAGISMVFQDPLGALNPVHTVGHQIAEALRLHDRTLTAAAARRRAAALLDEVGVADARRRTGAFPHELSGGMRQRVMIAMALANRPTVVVCDEPTSALDVTVQAQIAELLRTVRDQTGTAIAVVSHDLGLLASLADRVIVMYAGRAVESGHADAVLTRPRMPYTMGLLGAVPRPDAAGRRPLVPIAGAPPPASEPPPGCAFAPRCPLAVADCAAEEPRLSPIDDRDFSNDHAADLSRGDHGGHDTHRAACHRADEIGANRWTVTDVFAAPRRADPGDAADRYPDGGEVVPDTMGDPGRAETATATGTAGGETARPARSHPAPIAPEGPGAALRPHVAAVLRVTGLTRHHPLHPGVWRTVLRRPAGTVRAVDGVSFDLAPGETLALVGESGAGKTTVLREILELTRPQHGAVEVLGRTTTGLGARERRALRRQMQVVFQDPTSSLDPRMPVHDAVAEPLRAHGWPARQIPDRVAALLALVGLDTEHAARFPAHLSGGQRQRVAIARAIALDPRLLLLDEPVSALDVSVQAGVLNLLADLQARLGMSYLFVAHDLAVVRHIADRVAVLYLGRVVEIGTVERLYAMPTHPYTRALLSAAPVPDPVVERGRPRLLLRGDPSSAPASPDGCGFRARCPLFVHLDEAEQARCHTAAPPLRRRDTDHAVACHHTDP